MTPLLTYMPGSYIPPSCDFDHVTLNLTVVSAGRQFDRLGLMFLDDIETFRTSTAEPTADGIRWTYTKDMTDQLALFKTPRRITFDLGNLINDKYTASFNATLTAKFFTANLTTRRPSDVILPITSAEKYATANSSSAFSIPSERASRRLTLPRNAEKALVSIAACGQAKEEFWWSNAPSSRIDTFEKTALLGHSPFREVQLYIDGNMVGVAWPFPVIFTGGVAPGLWRPIVGIDAFDLKEDEIDISPWLPYLSDGREHEFEIKVVGLADHDDGNGTSIGVLSDDIGSSWVVTGKLFIWLDDEDHVTAGEQMRHFISDPKMRISSCAIEDESGNFNESMDYELEITRNIFTIAYVKTSGISRLATWSQLLSFYVYSTISSEGAEQLMSWESSGTASSSSFATRAYVYDLHADTTFTVHGNTSAFSIDAAVKFLKKEAVNFRAMDVSQFVSRPSVDEGNGSGNKEPIVQLASWQVGTAKYYSAPDDDDDDRQKSYSFGSTREDMEYDVFGDQRTDWRDVHVREHVFAVNGSVQAMDEHGNYSCDGGTGSGNEERLPLDRHADYRRNVGGRRSVREMLGRGPLG